MSGFSYVGLVGTENVDAFALVTRVKQREKRKEKEERI